MSADKSLHVPDADDHPAREDGRRDRSGASTRTQILAAAIELAKEKGAAHISIEAIARRAGLSKGGLLYHFATKDALVHALVEQHVADVEAAIADVETRNARIGGNALARAFVEVHRDNACGHKDKLDGILLALAENPHLLDPVRAYEKRLVERIRSAAADREMSLIALLVIEGIRALDLFEANVLADAERAAVLDRVLSLLDGGSEPV